MKDFSSFISPVRKSLNSVYLSTNGSLTNFYLQQARDTFLLYQRKKCSVLDISAISHQSQSLLKFTSQFLRNSYQWATFSLSNAVCFDFSTMISCPSSQLGKYLQEQVSCLLKAPHWCQQKTRCFPAVAESFLMKGQ